MGASLALVYLRSWVASATTKEPCWVSLVHICMGEAESYRSIKAEAAAQMVSPCTARQQYRKVRRLLAMLFLLQRCIPGTTAALLPNNHINRHLQK